MAKKSQKKGQSKSSVLPGEQANYKQNLFQELEGKLNDQILIWMNYEIKIL